MIDSAVNGLRMLGSDITQRWKLAASVVLPIVFAFSGCHHGPKMAQVSGKVFYKDGTVPHGGVCVVHFIPTSDSTAEVRQGAAGAINPNGSFTMHSRTPDDGVYYGKYAVTFSIWPGPMQPKSLVLPKYSSPVATPYKVTVDRDIDDLKFAIEPLPGVTGTAPVADTK